MSVIVPIFNQEEYLEVCLDSLVAQDFSDFEVILIDDGSTDRSAEICHKYITKYNNFRYYYQENSGLGEARNTGLKHAAGKYILFLDSDDAFRENSIGNLVDFAETRNADMVYFDEIICDSKLCVQTVARTYPEMCIEIDKVKALEFSLHPAHVWSRIYRRKLFAEICFTNIWYEDMDILPKLITVADRISYYKIPLYYYRQHCKGITHQEFDERNMEVITAWKNALGFKGYEADEKIALEKSVKQSIFVFSFFRPKFAKKFLEYYSEQFAGNRGCHVEVMPEIEVSQTQLWLQADFFGKRFICQLLFGLQKLFLEGGCLKIDVDKKVCFEECNVEKEYIALKYNEGISLKKIYLSKGNLAIYKGMRELASWNLISLKNQIKELVITECIVKFAIETGIMIVEDQDEE